MSGAAVPAPADPLSIDICFAEGDWPDPDRLDAVIRDAVAAAIAEARPPIAADAELSILLTDDGSIRALNARWRDRDRATNVLAFPQDGGPMLGDIVLAFETVRDEAALAERPLEHHIAHLIIHGFFHILGYDHADDRHANAMETAERAALSRLGIADPYRTAPPSP